jgi:hypothetical protein
MGGLKLDNGRSQSGTMGGPNYVPQQQWGIRHLLCSNWDILCSNCIGRSQSWMIEGPKVGLWEVSS